jgi:hypothetical protein
VFDRRAVKILFDTYWSSSGWRAAGHRNWVPETPAADLEYATSLGVMFPPRRESHDEALKSVDRLRARLSPRLVGDAFAWSLSGKNGPGLRSALGSYAVALHMPIHTYDPRHGDRRCYICGGYDSSEPTDLNILSFERHKWGGVRHADPSYISFDLERFMTEAGSIPKPPDQETLRALLNCCDTMPSGSKLADLVSAIRPIVSGNRDQRRNVIGILGLAGVLRIPGRSSFFHSFTFAAEREETPWYKDDWPYPTRWWRGGEGLDAEAVAFWFGKDIMRQLTIVGGCRGSR